MAEEKDDKKSNETKNDDGLIYESSRMRIFSKVVGESDIDIDTILTEGYDQFLNMYNGLNHQRHISDISISRDLGHIDFSIKYGKTKKR